MCKIEKVEIVRLKVYEYYTYNCQSGDKFVDNKTAYSVFIYLLKYKVGVTISLISKIVGKTRSTVSRNISKFEDNLQYDKILKRELLEIEEELRELV